MIALVLAMSCAAPWTLGAPPTEVVPGAVVETTPEPLVHSVMAVEELDLRALREAWVDAGSLPVTLILLEPGEVPQSASSVSLVGATLVAGELRASEISVEVTPPAEPLPDQGWAGEVARRLQERLLQANISLLDPVYADAPAHSNPDAGMTFEVKRVPGDHGGTDLQLRVMRTPEGEVVVMERASVAVESVGVSYARAADRLLESSTEALARR